MLRHLRGGWFLKLGAKSSGRIIAGLGVRANEVGRLRAVMVSSFLLGVSLVFYYSASNAIFLTRYGVQKLPYVYIVNGFLVIAFGVGLAFLGRHVTFRTQTLTVNFVLAATILVLWAGVRTGGSHAAIFVMMAWFRLLFIYTTLGLWEHASRLFDIRQAKRLFSLVGLGVMLAAVVGGVLTPVIVDAVGTVDVLLLSAVFLGLYAVSLSRILRDVNETRRNAKRYRRADLRYLARDRYTQTISGLQTFSVLTAYLVEYVFYEQASRYFPGQASLASFLGTFFGGATLAMVLVTALLTSRLIVGLGVRGTLFVMPLAMMATSLAATAYGSLAGINLAVFGLVATAMFANQVLDKAVHTPAFVLLFQPIPRVRRMPVRVMVEGWLGSVALILSGALLLFVASLHPPNIVPFVALLAVVSAIFLLLCRAATAQYVKALRRSTGRGFAGRQQPVDGPSAATAVLLERLAPGTSPAEQEEGRAALRASTPLLDNEKLSAAVQAQVQSASSLLAAERDLSAAWPLLAVCLHEELGRVRANLFSVLCCLRDASGAPLADIIIDAETRITNGMADDRANAIELLDVTLPKRLGRPLVALAEDDRPLQTLRKLSGGLVPAPLAARERLALMERDASLDSWTLGLVRLGLAAVSASAANTSAANTSAANTGKEVYGMPEPGLYPPEVASVVWLRTVDIFRGVPYQLLSELSGRLRPLAVSAGVRIVAEGEDGDELYIVRSGEVAIQHADDAVARLGPGSVFGESAVLDPGPRPADVVATVDVDLLILDRATLLDLMGRRPEVAADIITMLVRRLRADTPRA
jgi:Cyclic nucleotide-binding domain